MKKMMKLNIASEVYYPYKILSFFGDIIKEKIIYVYDKDLIGYDSANLYAFQFRLWMMEKFNMSKNFILMDDDYFIGKPLKKSDFFYVEDGKVVPSIVSTDFTFLNEKSVNKNHDYYKKRIKKTQSGEHFLYSIMTSYIFTMKLLNNTFIFPKFTHNAVPCNIEDIKELYYLVLDSKYKYSTLDSLYRHTEALQFVTFLMAYTFKKYNKKVNPISHTYIDNNVTIISNFNYSLFCINTGNDYYTPLSFMKSKLTMEHLFPEISPYEIKNDTYVINLAFDIIYQIEKQNIQFIRKRKLIIIFIYIILGIIIITLVIWFIYKKLHLYYKRSPKLIINEESQKKINNSLQLTEIK